MDELSTAERFRRETARRTRRACALPSSGSNGVHAQGQMFRLKTPTLGIISSDDGHRVAVTIPQDAIVSGVNGPLDKDRMVDVVWEGKTVMMFTQDLRTRGEQVDGAGEPPSTFKA